MRYVVVSILVGLVGAGTLRPIKAQSPSNDPQLALWRDVKRQLQGPNGKQYFELVLKDALVPGATDSVHALRGTVLSNKPAKRPSELVLAISDSHTPEVTMTLRDARENLTPLLKPIAPGTEVEFWGVPVSFTPNPFMLTFEVRAESGPSGVNPRIVTRAPQKAKP
jgi:hypothetical protein